MEENDKSKENKKDIWKNSSNMEEINLLMGLGIKKDDEISKSDEKKEVTQTETVKLLNEERNSYMQIDSEFREFLSDFVDLQHYKERQKLHFKALFFWIIMLGFLVLFLLPGVIILWAGKLSELTMAVALVSSLIELVSAIIILPKIIAEYLFNKEEDKNMMEIIKSMQEYNERKHEHIRQNDTES